MPERDSETGKRGPGPERPRILLFWWVASLLLFLWYLSSLWPHSQPREHIPYSVFLAQLADNNLSRIHIAGDTIDGEFLKPVPWPPGETASPSTASSTSTTSAKSALPNPQTSPEPAPQAANREFSTTFPATVGDPGLMPMLIAHHFEVEVSSSSTPWFVQLLLGWGPLILLVGLFWWLSSRAARTQSGLFGFGRVRTKRYSTDQPKITFNDVAGADEAKAELQEEVDFLRHPKKYHDLGARIPRGVLLVRARADKARRCAPGERSGG